MSIECTVREAPEGVPAHGVGLPATLLTWLDAEAGAVVTVEGTDRTAGTVVEVDGSEPEAFLPERVRHNAGVSPGDTVRVGTDEGPTAGTVRFRLADDFDVTRAETVLRERLSGVPVSEGDRIAVSLLDGGLTLDLAVVVVEPRSPAVVRSSTTVVVTDGGPGAAETVTVPTATYDDLAGIEEAVDDLDGLVRSRFDHADAFVSMGRPPGAGVLLHGPAGSGKRTLAEALAAETDARFVSTTAGRLLDDRAELDGVADAAADAGRCLVLLEDLDVLAEAGDTRLATAVGALVSEARKEGAVVVGTATDPDAVPATLRRSGRLDRAYELDPLDRAGRLAVLESYLSGVTLAEGVDLAGVAGAAHGFVAGDLGTLADRAVEAAAEREGPLVVRQRDLDRAVEAVEPSGLRELAVDVPEVAWESVGGLDEAKRELIRAVHWPLTYPEFFDDAGIDPPRGVLLYGPPGTGKTLLSRAVASLSDANFVSVKGPELLDRYVGASEQAVRDLFETARRNAPTVIFFDEIDALSPRRREGDTDVSERVVSQLLTELDGLEPLGDVFVVAATNRPDIIDPALLRPGRLEKAVETPLPDRAAREEILAIHTDGMPLAADVDLSVLADRTEGYSGGDLAALVREAAMLAIEETVLDDRRLVVGRAQFEAALEQVSPSVSETDRESYAAFGDRS